MAKRTNKTNAQKAADLAKLHNSTALSPVTGGETEKPGSNEGAIVAPVLMWQTLEATVETRKEDKMAAIRVIHDAGATDEERMAVIARMPHWEEQTVRESRGKQAKRKAGAKVPTILSMLVYYRAMSPKGQEQDARISVIKASKKLTSGQKNEIRDLSRNMNAAVKVLCDARRLQDAWQRVTGAGYSVSFAYDRKTWQPVTVKAKDAQGDVTDKVDLTVAEFSALYPEGVAGDKTLTKLLDAEKPVDPADKKGPDAARADDKNGKAHFMKLEEVTNALSGVAGFIGDDGRRNLVRQADLKSNVYAFSRETFFLLGDVLAAKAKDAGEVYAALAMLKGIIPEADHTPMTAAEAGKALHPAAVNGKAEPARKLA